MTRETIAANLKTARTCRGLTLGQLARKSGVQKSTLIGYEHARAMPGAINLALIARALRVSSDRILGIE